MQNGIGLGLRREFIQTLYQHPQSGAVSFLEIAPENWIHIGGKRQKYLDANAAKFPIICHGLSLSIGSLAPLNIEFINELKLFLDHFNVSLYSEHLSYCSDEQGMLYDLLPMPFTEEAVHYVSKRIREVQDRLERTIALENISYYCQMPGELSEIEFINAVLAESNCHLLLDVNNVYVNSINHQQYQTNTFIDSFPSEKIAYLHIAGHLKKSASLIIDTHGANIEDHVWDILKYTYQAHGLKPTLLERDNNIPSLDELLQEVNTIKNIQQTCLEASHAEL